MRLKPSSLRLNESHPLANRLVVAAIPLGDSTTRVLDYSRSNYENAGVFSVVNGAFGTVVQGNNTAFRSVRYTFPTITIGPKFCFAAVIDRWNTKLSGTDRFALSVGSNATDSTLLGFDANASTAASGPSGSSIAGFVRDGSSAGPSGFGAATGLRDNSPHVLIVDSVAGNSHRFFADGLLNATSSTSISTIAVNRFSLLSALRIGDTLNWSGGVAGGWLWNRSLSDNEISELSSDPFAMFRTRQRSYFYAGIAAGGSDQTISLGKSTSTETANALTVSNPRTYMLGRATEADVANALSVLNPRSYAIGTANEVSTANGLTVSNPRSYALGKATSTETANGLTVGNDQSILLGKATETNTAIAITVVNPRTVALGKAIETNIANGLIIGNGITVSLGRATEVSIGRAMTIINPRAYTLGKATETNYPRGLTVDTGGGSLISQYYFHLLG
jgi:hypothetical protein